MPATARSLLPSGQREPDCTRAELLLHDPGIAVDLIGAAEMNAGRMNNPLPQ